MAEPLGNPGPENEGPYEEANGTCVGNFHLNWCGRCQPMNEESCPGTDPGCIHAGS